MVTLISNADQSYLREILHLQSWCQANKLQQNVNKTKQPIVDFSWKQKMDVSPLSIGERVDCFRYLDVNISQDLTWSTHINTVVKKTR